MKSQPFPIHFINLDRAVERRSFMEAQGEALGLALTRLRAVETKDVSEADMARLSIQWERRLTGPEIGCFLSHRALWEIAAASPAGIVVLEDDAVLSKRFRTLDRRLVEGWDLVNLEAYGRRKFFRRRPHATIGSLTVTGVARDKSGSAAYYVSPAGARALLADAERAAAPVDAYLFHDGRLRMAQVEPALAVQVEVLARLGVETAIAAPTQIHQARKHDPSEPLRRLFARRRLATQARLVRYHLRRCVDLDFRLPKLERGDFERPNRADQAGPSSSANSAE